MAAEQNKAIVRRFLDECISNGNAELADELFAEDFVSDFIGLPEPVRGIDAWKQLARNYFNGFPDLRLIETELIGENDTVVARWTWRGTQSGDFMGIPATGKVVEASGMGLYRIADGKIAYEWVCEDNLGMMQQLGVISTPESTEAH
jgi:steroid delta-isomerase-like uncharacterized protein